MKKEKMYYLIVIIFILFVNGCNKDSVSNSDFDSSSAVTTLERTIVPVQVSVYPPRILPYEVSKFSQYGYGVWYYGAGIDFQKRLDIMPASYTGNSVKSASKFLHFFTMTDIHITDVQSPAQTIYFGLTNTGHSSCYSPNIIYSSQVLDAAIKTVNLINANEKVDFGLFLGDAINNAQYNELRLYIDVIDGKYVNPNSNPLIPATPDYLRPFQAVGLDKSIPWYQVIGNHDHFWQGVHPPNDYIKQTLIGENILNLGNVVVTNDLESRGYYMGIIDGTTELGEIKFAGPVDGFSTIPKINANSERHYLNRSEFRAEFSNTSSNPIGHGFMNNAVPGCYSFEPKSEMPIKIIVLDNSQDENCALGQGTLAYFDDEKYNWLVSELDKGEEEGKLMIIAAHIPIGISNALYEANSVISQNELVAKLKTYSNILLWVSGHVHRNTVTAFPSSDSNHPEFGFWEVETASLKEFPQMFRLFEIVRNNDNTISIFTTNVNPAFTHGSPAEKSLSYSIASSVLYTHIAVPPSYIPTGGYNAELVKQLSPEMIEKIKNY